MTDTVKTVLIVAGVAVGAYVLLEVARPARSPSTYTRGAASSSTWLSSLLQFGTAVASAPTGGPNTYGQPSPTADPSWYDNQQGIDPNTGGVLLAPGDYYGPRFAT